MYKDLKEKLKREVNKVLPGTSAHQLLSPVKIEHYQSNTSNANPASVMAIIHPHLDQWNLVFIKRTSQHKDDKHGGQISFPGGKKEAKENDLECAIRETEEEIGLFQHNYEVIGPLSPIFVYVSNFLVQPYLAITNDALIFKKQEEEVEQIIQHPISSLLNPMSSIITNVPTFRGILKNVPAYDLNGHILWGATAMITAEIIELLKASGYFIRD